MKRVFDLLASIFLLVALAVPFAAIFLLIRGFLGKPAIFKQTRPGLRGKPFVMYKFRTMTDARDSQGNLLPDSVRLTSFGKFLRSTSLDELPELWNVLIGNMSLVGPRPLLMEYLPLYSENQRRRHEVRPGITGWAQVNGRNAISWDEKFNLDVWYVDNHSIVLDIRILFMTLFKVVKRDNINAADGNTVAPFTGNTTPPSKS